MSERVGVQNKHSNVKRRKKWMARFRQRKVREKLQAYRRACNAMVQAHAQKDKAMVLGALVDMQSLLRDDADQPGKVR